ncbi:MAG: hypothetical protein AUG44_08650 [Actinobacteria bacterium 13_1_20CM_3_71_11]|nr:MAG: hypothetical protein AUG44_08650 [Actinobacteria bacterium 13_1_20CM_3_71_11]
MSEQLTPNQVALQLARLARELDDLVAAIDDAEKNAVNAREDFTMTYAKAFLTAEGSMEVRKHKATVDTHAARIGAELAEQQVKGIRRQIDSVKIRIDVGRSLGAALRAEISLGGVS